RALARRLHRVFLVVAALLLGKVLLAVAEDRAVLRVGEGAALATAPDGVARFRGKLRQRHLHDRVDGVRGCLLRDRRKTAEREREREERASDHAEARALFCATLSAKRCASIT